MEEDIVLKIKEKESLEVLRYIALWYSLFLFFLGLLLKFQETIIEVSFIVVFSVVINALNCGEIIISGKGLRTKPTGFIKYKNIYRLELNKRVLTVYTRDSKKPFKIFFDNREDINEIKRVYIYMESKVKGLEDVSKEHEEYVKKYL